MFDVFWPDNLIFDYLELRVSYAMAATQHLQVFDTYGRGEEDFFGQFSMLPPELRLRIWQCTLEKHRLVNIELEFPSDGNDTPPYSTTNALGKIVSGQWYLATVQGFQLNSKLLRVNRESRSVALAFYRIHIPCYRRKESYKSMSLYRHWAARTERTTLYFNRIRLPAAKFFYEGFLEDCNRKRRLVLLILR